ncbi:uncharacterized protein LOC122948449 [Acropora millepora]|uniref:uncharacterized protein LOC122948449 n=1 Tax=Acropora millepora TaxID=45264 RepID=UPI001CF2B505|nr:uncharacterized protein LOC122948449 [Acropora millepora]
MDRRLRGAPLVFAFLVCVLTALLQEGKSEVTAGEDVVKPHNCTATPSSSTAVLLSWEFPTRNGTSKPANYTVRESGYSKLYPLCKTKFAIKLVDIGKITTVKRPLNYKKFGRSLHEFF